MVCIYNKFTKLKIHKCISEMNEKHDKFIFFKHYQSMIKKALNI